METQIHRYTVDGPGSVNSYVVETADAVVLIDAQRQISSAVGLADLAQRTGKPVRMILLTHPHPDHFGGLAHLKSCFPDAELAMSAAAADELETDSRGYFALTRQVLPDDTAEELPRPDRILAGDDVIEVSGINLRATEWGLGECFTAMTFAEDQLGAVFCADIVTNGMTPFLLEGRTREWLDQIDALERCFDGETVAYSGHGAEAPLKHLAEQTRSYLMLVRDAVAAGRTTTSIRDEVDQAYPGYLPVAEIPDLVVANIEAVRSEFARGEGV
ncbi:MAG: MBL fold metallo-hydrolase [Pseudomonadota bacterium]